MGAQESHRCFQDLSSSVFCREIQDTQATAIGAAKHGLIRPRVRVMVVVAASRADWQMPRIHAEREMGLGSGLWVVSVAVLV